jgi:hypothetical protein
MKINQSEEQEKKEQRKMNRTSEAGTMPTSVNQL